MPVKFIPPKVPAFQRYTAKLLGATMFFFMMYRAREDGLTTIGWSKPWEESHGHDDHHDNHGKH